MRISKTIKQAIKNGLADSHMHLTEETINDIIKYVGFHVRDVLAHKFMKYTNSKNKEVAKAAWDLWKNLFPEEKSKE